MLAWSFMIMTNNNILLLLMICWHEHVIVRVTKYSLWLQQRNYLVIKTLYASFLHRGRVHTRIYFRGVVYTFCKSSEYVRMCQVLKSHTYVGILYRSHVQLLGFLKHELLMTVDHLSYVGCCLLMMSLYFWKYWLSWNDCGMKF